MVAIDGSKGDFTTNTNFSKFEDSLSRHNQLAKVASLSPTENVFFLEEMYVQFVHLAQCHR